MDWKFDIIVYSILLLIVCFGCARKAALDQTEILQRLNDLRGVFAVEIVIGHVIRYEKTLLFPLGKFMIISVAFFFFVSAWGLVNSFNQKKNYLNNFLLNKVGYIVILVVISFLFNYIIDYFVPFSLNYYNSGELLLKTIWETTNWYLWELVGFYIIFYLCYKYVKGYNALISFAITIVFVTLAFMRGWQECWYASAIAFPVGLVMGTYNEQIMKFINSYKGYAITSLMVILGLSSQLFSKKSLFGMAYLRNIMCMSVLLILIYICQTYKMSNRVIDFLGNYSTEIYLFQFTWLGIFLSTKMHYSLKVILVLGLTIITAVIFHPIIQRLKRMVIRK